jgi:hypothetical protein
VSIHRIQSTRWPCTIRAHESRLFLILLLVMKTLDQGRRVNFVHSNPKLIISVLTLITPPINTLTIR